MNNPCNNLYVFLTALLSLISLSTSKKALTPTQPLSDGETLISAKGAFALGFFAPAGADDNRRYVGIWYNNIPVHTVIWVANRARPVYGTSGKLLITTNGTLMVTDENSTVFWCSTSTEGVLNAIARLLDTSNFVVTNGNDLGNFAWQSFDYPTDTQVPGMKLGWNLTSRLTRNITSWLSPTDPSPGNYTFTMDLRGDPQLIMWAGAARKLRSGPWTGLTFSGLVPYKTPSITQFGLVFAKNKEEVFFGITVSDSTTITRIVMNSSGSEQHFVWVASSGWNLFWDTPRTQCDSYLICGPSGSVCYTDRTPMCSCLPGFMPKSQANWALRDWSGGCVRTTTLDCRNGTDGFVTVQRSLLPDTVNAAVYESLSLDECKAECLKNCSCTAVASADTRNGGSGCIIWTTTLSDILVYSDSGQDFYLRLAAADIVQESSESHKSRKATLAIILFLLLGPALFVIAVCYGWRKWKQSRGTIAETTVEHDMELPLYDLETVIAATNNFAIENKLGEGGFGPVFKGRTKEGQGIAVKRLSKSSAQGFEELKTEVILVAKLQHRNLVKLLGCCIQGDERMLIYEYMPNKSLDAFLFDEEKVLLLDWRTRYQIIVGVARGLLYLHQDSRFRIIHRDLKAANILLDKDMVPKISDFGLARLFGEDDTKTRTKRVVGTYGYMSPEYALNGIFSIKSDVFSYGVLVLEILSGKRNKGVYLTDAEEYLLGKAWSIWKEGRALELIDTSLGSSFSTSEVLRCMKVGLLCVQERPEDRPTMLSVVLMLASDNVSLPEPNEPGFVARKISPEGTSSSKNSCSVNELTLTTSVAR